MLAVNRSQLFQTIEGFGGAFTDSTSHVFDSMPTAAQEQLLELYFGPSGLRYTMGRLTIGSCDFSTSYYNYDDVKDDFNLTHFNISHDEDKILPFVRRAMKAAERSRRTRRSRRDTDAPGPPPNSTPPIKFISSPWSAPAWMKENDKMNCDLGPWTCVLKSSKNGAYKQAWAEYLGKYIEAYGAAGVPIWAITVQNEPEAQTGNLVYEGMHFTPQTEKDFLTSHLGPLMQARHPLVKVLIYDHNKDHIVDWATAILGDPAASAYVWGTAFHWYANAGFKNLATVHEMFPQFALLSTESTAAKQTHGTYDKPDWTKGEHYGREILGDINNWSVGFVDWNLLLDEYGGPNHSDPTGGECEKLIKCGSDAMVIYQDGKLYPQAYYYYMGHVSKFIPPGSVRVGLATVGGSGGAAPANASAAPTAVLATAAVTPAGGTVVVAMNQGDEAAPITLADPARGTASATLPPHSIATFVY